MAVEFPERRRETLLMAAHEKLIEGVGEIVEEKVPVVPRYLQLSHVVAVAKEGKAPGELMSGLKVSL